ncbi:hypothetical protein V866_001830 [Kwoniella sp. B9012]
MSDRGMSFQPSTYYPSEIPAIFLPDEIDLSGTTLSNHRDSFSSSSTRSKRPSILPKRDSLPPPPRHKSASSSRRTSAQSSPVTYSRTDGEGGIDFTKDPFDNAFHKAEWDRQDGMRPTHRDAAQEGPFKILQKEELHHIKTVSILEGRHEPSDRNINRNSNGLKLEFWDKDDQKFFDNMEADEGNEKDREPVKTPKTPKDFIQDHFTLKTPRMPVPFTAKSLPIPVPIPTHINLPTPIMPIIHLLLVISHLVLSALLPYLLFKNFIQPLVLWIVTTVTVVLQCVYLLPGIFLELIGILRRRPVDSAWLQSGLHLVIMILSLAPHAAAVFLLIIANQVPECPSALIYKPPNLPNFESHLRWSACEQLPKVTMIAMVNLVVVICEIITTSIAVAVDYRIQWKEEKLRSIDVSVGEKAIKKRRRRTWWKEKDEPMKVSRRRWTTGVGRLLWDIEGWVHRRKAQNEEQKSAVRKAAVAGTVTGSPAEFTFLTENLPPLPRIQDEHLAAAAFDESSVEFLKLALLGDRLFEIAASKSLWNSCTTNTTLANGKQKLTTNRTFSRIAEAYDLPKKLRGSGPKPPVISEKKLGSALEVLLGAAYLDAWKHGNEREPLRWAAQVLDMDRWSGLEEYMVQAESKHGRTGDYAIAAKGDIWALDQVRGGIRPLEGNTAVSTTTRKSIFSRILGLIWPASSSQTEKPTKKPPVTLSTLLRRRRLSQETVLSPFTIPNTATANDLTRSAYADSVPSETMTSNGWKPSRLPLNPHALPSLLPISVESEALLRNLSDKDSNTYQQKGLLQLYKFLRQALSVYNHSKESLGKITGLLVSSQTLSHIGHHYGFSTQNDESRRSQTETARQFARSFAMLIKDRKGKNEDQSLLSWMRKVFSKGVFPTIDGSALSESTTLGVRIHTSQPPQASASKPISSPPSFVSPERAKTEKIMDILSDLEQRLHRVEKSVFSLQTPTVDRHIEQPSPSQQAVRIPSESLNMEAAITPTISNAPHGTNLAPRSWRLVTPPKEWATPIIQVNLSELLPLPDALRGKIYNDFKRKYSSYEESVKAGRCWFQTNMSKIIGPQCQHEATLKYVLKHHTDLAVTSYLAKHYNLEPLVTNGRITGGDQQLDYSEIFGMIGRLRQNVDGPDSQKWLSALTSPMTWPHIKKLAAAFEKSGTRQRQGVTIEGEESAFASTTSSKLLEDTNKRSKRLTISTKPSASLDVRADQPAAYTSADTLNRHWATAGIRFDPDKLPTLYRNEHVTIDVDFFAQSDEEMDEARRVWHDTVFEHIKDSLKKYTESEPAIMVATCRLISNKTLSYLAFHYCLFDPSKSLPSQRDMAQRMRKYVALLLDQSAEHGSRQELMSWFDRLWAVEAWPTLQDVILEAQNRQSFDFDVRTSEMSALATGNNGNESYTLSPPEPRQGDELDPPTSSGGLKESDLSIAEGETVNPGMRQTTISIDTLKLPPPLTEVSIDDSELYEILEPDSEELVCSDYRTNMDFLTQSLIGRWEEEDAILLASKTLLETGSLVPLPSLYGLDRDQEEQLLAPEVSAQLFRRYTALLLKRAAKESRMIKLIIEDWLRQVYSPDSRPGLRLHVRAKLREQRQRTTFGLKRMENNSPPDALLREFEELPKDDAISTSSKQAKAPSIKQEADSNQPART